MESEKRSDKRCPRCNLVLPLNRFDACSQRSDGLQGYCRECSHSNTNAWKRARRNSGVKARGEGK